MKAIKTTYLGPTNYRGSRIKATDEDGNSVTFPYFPEKHMEKEAHSVAAIALCKTMGWEGTLVAGSLKDCYVFCFMSSKQYDINLTLKEQGTATARWQKKLETPELLKALQFVQRSFALGDISWRHGVNGTLEAVVNKAIIKALGKEVSA